MKQYVFSGTSRGKSYVTIDGDRLTIKRKGLFSLMTYGLSGEKTFNISQISGTHYKKSNIAGGYLKFVIVGSQDNKTGFKGAQKDENAVCWNNKKQNEYAEEIINYINKFNGQKQNTKSDNYDKLRELKKLLDDGVINQEEFNNEKQKILN